MIIRLGDAWPGDVLIMPNARFGCVYCYMHKGKSRIGLRVVRRADEPPSREWWDYDRVWLVGVGRQWPRGRREKTT